jgi:hypothetical protein
MVRRKLKVYTKFSVSTLVGIIKLDSTLSGDGLRNYFRERLVLDFLSLNNRGCLLSCQHHPTSARV